MGFRDLTRRKVARLNGQEVVLEAELLLPTKADIERIPVPSKQIQSFDDLPKLFGEYGNR